MYENCFVQTKNYSNRLQLPVMERNFTFTLPSLKIPVYIPENISMVMGGQKEPIVFVYCDTFKFSFVLIDCKDLGPPCVSDHQWTENPSL